MDTFFFLFDRCCCSWGDAKVHGFFGKGSDCGELAHDGLVFGRRRVGIGSMF